MTLTVKESFNFIDTLIYTAHMKRFTLTLAGLCLALLANAGGPERMDLAGLWRFQLDPMGFGKTAGSELYLARLTETIHLPGSTDEGAKGVKNTVSHVDRLSRKYEYCGQAWYQREVTVPAGWAGRSVSLELERCHWETAVYVDGRPVATDERLSTPNRFDLTPYLTPGTHTLTLCVDNRLKYPMDQWNHGTTEYTQTNWNGVVGRMELVARTRGHIADVQLYPDVEGGAVRIKAGLTPAGEDLKGRLTLTVREKGGPAVAERTLDVTLDDSAATQVDERVSLGRDVRLWDEFTPALYEVEASLATEQGTDTRRETFGMRRVEQGPHHVRVNGRNVHLRGSLECCVFPLTGYPATDTASWKRIFRTAKAYGLNHIRFHSWCPPEAAFDAADEVGIYLQAELPMWVKDVGKYPARRDFFEKEMYAILDEYGNHPSFVLMCGGNENEGDFTVLEDLVVKAQRHDPRRLYSASTARTHVKADQFYVSHVTGNGWITVYEGQPSTDWDRSKESAVDVPVIAHETGQRCMYPNFGEMAKYSGVLEPRNFAVFRDRLARNGMLGQADDFFRATGAHTVLQYKEVNESLLRSATSGGFQLLGLTDFPGQGCAYVGILDAFWETKGLVTPEKYRESCGPMVLLARLPKRVYLNSEHFTARMGLYHYGPDDLGRGRIGWQLVDSAGTALASGHFRHGAISRSTVTDSLGFVDVDLSAVTRPGKYTLHATLDGVSLHNEWDIWVYPAEATPSPTAGYTLARDWATARRQLEAGGNVLLVPDNCPGRKTHFASHFWNPIMFNWDPMIVGTRIEEGHPAFSQFPTAYYADWQWWDVLNHAHALDLTDIDGLTPVIQSVDTYEQNRKLGIAFEANVDRGRLFVLCVDTRKDLDARPATRQLLRSVEAYVASDAFRPAATCRPWEIERLFSPAPATAAGSADNAAIRQLLNQ